MKAIWNGAVLAESDDTVMAEGNHCWVRRIKGRVAFSNGVQVVADDPTRGRTVTR